MTRISIVIPLYNHESFIGEAIRSVLSQTEPDLELIVIDDGSIDRSYSVASGFTDPRLRVFRQANQGAHAAINNGLSQAQGEYLAILNSDDVYHPDRCAVLSDALESNPTVGLAASYIEVIDEHGRTLGIKHGYHDLEPWSLKSPEKSFRAGTDLHEALLTENYLATTSNFMFRRETFHRLGGFRNLRYAHDWDFALQIAAEASVMLVPKPLLKYRVHARNTIRENQAGMIFEICWCLAMHLPRFMNVLEKPTSDYRKFIERLLHSMYTYGMEHVLVTLLLQEIARHERTALELLQAENPLRQTYLEYIQQVLEVRGSSIDADDAKIAGRARLSRKTPKGILERLIEQIRRV